ncbi:TnsA endonuclease N-terminal domain-containing protein [Pseudomonas sp. G(2018)]|uniref:TnsA endonuclease N-terminal domain-containing protein n=1 Tax=Pseudomonas sp. G(2018) TaxID=2502242 RepID=UPI0010F71069|nr:TnsA endonuclease N-terminal domain-containing protein [Pseudomonas sp. G(2018)]
MTSIDLSRIQNRLANIAICTKCKLPKHGRKGSQVTIFPSRKNAAAVICESRLEAHFCVELERSRNVLQYEAHPFTIHFMEGRYRYTPDFLVQFTDGEQKLIEVKNDHSYQDKNITGRITRYVDWLAEQGCILEYLPAAKFYGKIRTPNLIRLYHGAYSSRGSASSSIRTLLTQCVPNRRPIDFLIDNGYAPEDIAYALFYRAIHCDIFKPLCLTSLVWI